MSVSDGGGPFIGLIIEHYEVPYRELDISEAIKRFKTEFKTLKLTVVNRGGGGYCRIALNID